MLEKTDSTTSIVADLSDDKPAEPPAKFLQQELIDTVSEEISLDTHYFLPLLFSTLIAALGILTNSATVVIGAMLISPLFWPIIGLTLSIITTRRHLAKRSSLNLLLSVVMVLILSYILAVISPLDQITTEISIRTKPTLLDLFIAMATSAIGVLAIYDPRISRTASGVAISIALLPALCVSGIGIAFQSWEIFLGSLLLFATNTGAIIFVGVVTLYLLNFRPRIEKEQARMRVGLAISFAFLIALTIPLTFFFQQGINQNATSSKINRILNEEIRILSERASADDLQITFPRLVSNGPVEVEATVYLPEGEIFTSEEQNRIIDRLAVETSRNVQVQFNLVNTLNLAKERDESLRQEREEIRIELINHLADLNLLTQLESIDIRLPINEASQAVQVLVILKESANQAVTFDQKLALEKSLIDTFNRLFEVEIELLPIRRLSQVSPEDQFKALVVSTLEDRLNLISPESYFADIQVRFPQNAIGQMSSASESAVLGISSARVRATAYVPTGEEFQNNLADILQRSLTMATDASVDLQLHVVEFITLD